MNPAHPALQLSPPELDPEASCYLGPVFALSRPEQPHTESACITFMPALMVHNDLPAPVDLQISTPQLVDESGPFSPPGDSAVQLKVPARQQEALAATCISGETISWTLRSSPAQHTSKPSAAQVAPSTPNTNVGSPWSTPLVASASLAMQAPALKWSAPFSTAASNTSGPTAGSAARSNSNWHPGPVSPTATLPLPQPGSSCNLQLPLPQAPPWLDSIDVPQSPQVTSQARAQHAPGRSTSVACCMLICSPATALEGPLHHPNAADHKDPEALLRPGADSAGSGQMPRTLTLVPHAAVINESPWWVRLEVPGAAQPGSWVGPGQGLPMDWHPLRFRPRKVALAAAVPPHLSSSETLDTAQQPASQLLRCAAFKVASPAFTTFCRYPVVLACFLHRSAWCTSLLPT